MADNGNDARSGMGDFMRGRNGADELSNAAVCLAVILLIINLFGRWIFLSVIVLLLLAYALFRMLSTDGGARQREADAFGSAVGPLRPWLRDPVVAWQESRAYKHGICPNCHQRVRVPRGKGLLRVTCPQCKQKFEIKS